MDFLTAIILGIIQGITEWLPISSSAMVTLAGKLIFNFNYSEALGNAIWLHGGTSLAAIIYFRNEIINLFKSIYKKDRSKDLLVFLSITTLFSFIIAGILSLFLFSIHIPEVIFTLFIGFFLLIIAFLHKNRKESKIEEALTKTKATVVGVLQGVSVLPGISRSGVTVSVLLIQNFSLKSSFKLSFLMSIPATLGASIFLPLLKQDFVITGPLVLGGIVAFITGLLTIRMLMTFAEKVNFYKATFILGLVVVLLGLFQLFF
ncbi:undecaprenyl-diphosphate phosphatase [Candidatus Micrarchaeota archaeon]|nr:undecaprenyl-diphosphate phosphatase [Candidatus Micrarchaeota archaeon]